MPALMSGDDVVDLSGYGTARYIGTHIPLICTKVGSRSGGLRLGAWKSDHLQIDTPGNIPHDVSAKVLKACDY